jgi:hypothetical protein
MPEIEQPDTENGSMSQLTHPNKVVTQIQSEKEALPEAAS